MSLANNDLQVPNFVTEAIKQALIRESEKLIAEAKKELERRTPEIISGVVVEVMQMVDVQYMQDRFVFTILKKKP